MKRVYLNPDDTVSTLSWGILHSMMPFSVPDVIVSTFLLVRGFALVTVVQFTRGTVIRFSWISITSLEGRRFALNSCELLTEELHPQDTHQRNSAVNYVR